MEALVCGIVEVRCRCGDVLASDGESSRVARCPSCGEEVLFARRLSGLTRSRSVPAGLLDRLLGALRAFPLDRAG
jgi:hypothetical protein